MTVTDRADLASEPVLEERAAQLAAEWLLQGRRLEMQALADDLGVSRVTLFRNVGTREELLSAALWTIIEPTLQHALARWETERPAGALYSTGTGRRINAMVARSTALHGLLDREPALTIRVLTDPRGRVQTGVVAFVEEVLRRDIRELGYVPIADPHDLAFALVRLGESFLYADVLASRPPDVATADRLQQAVVEAALVPGHHPSSETTRKTRR